MYNKCGCYCSNLTNFWKEGTYQSKLFSAEGLEVLSGTDKVEYMYNCCKINGVKITSVSTFQGKTITTNIKYYCNGNYILTNSEGSKTCGKWVNKCGKLCTLVSGTDTVLGEGTGKGKFVDMKDGVNYKGEWYGSENGKCILKYRYTYTKV